jgi:hypothetical protein
VALQKFGHFLWLDPCFFIVLLLWKALWESPWLFLRKNLIINGKTAITIAHKRSIYCWPIPIYFRPDIGILSRDPPFKVGPLFWYVNTQWLPRAPSSTIFVNVYWGLQEKRKISSVPDPYVLGPPGSGFVSQRYGSGSFHHQAKIVRKSFISTVLWLRYDLLSLKTDLNVSSKKKNRKKNIFCWCLEGRWRKEQDPEPDPDPLVRGRDPRIRIHTKMSRIRNTVFCFDRRHLTGNTAEDLALVWLLNGNRLKVGLLFDLAHIIHCTDLLE